MKAFSGFLKIVVLVLIMVGALVFVIMNYDWVFAKRVVGEVVDVERVTDPTAVFASRPTEALMYSYSILIQGEDGKLYTSSSEDRQWQVVKKGYCVDALLYRYPPWHLSKGNTFYNARLKDVRVCPGKSALPNADSPETPPATPEPLPGQLPAGK